MKRISKIGIVLVAMVVATVSMTACTNGSGWERRFDPFRIGHRTIVRRIDILGLINAENAIWSDYSIWREDDFFGGSSGIDRPHESADVGSAIDDLINQGLFVMEIQSGGWYGVYSWGDIGNFVDDFDFNFDFFIEDIMQEMGGFFGMYSGLNSIIMGIGFDAEVTIFQFNTSSRAQSFVRGMIEEVQNNPWGITEIWRNGSVVYIGDQNGINIVRSPLGGSREF